jgi:hypothetical protein
MGCDGSLDVSFARQSNSSPGSYRGPRSPESQAGNSYRRGQWARRSVGERVAARPDATRITNDAPQCQGHLARLQRRLDELDQGEP